MWCNAQVIHNFNKHRWDISNVYPCLYSDKYKETFENIHSSVSLDIIRRRYKQNIRLEEIKNKYGQSKEKRIYEKYAEIERIVITEKGDMHAKIREQFKRRDTQ